jgi:hypothetical protein
MNVTNAHQTNSIAASPPTAFAQTQLTSSTSSGSLPQFTTNQLIGMAAALNTPLTPLHMAAYANNTNALLASIQQQQQSQQQNQNLLNSANG